MKLSIVGSILLLISPVVLAQSDTELDRHFTGRTLRFDYYHTGTAGEEHISVDRLRLEGEWGGRRRKLLDDTNLGQYRFEVVDPSTQLAIYSAGFSSIYGEWETIGEARRGVWRTFHESQRFPEPKQPVQLLLKKRAADGTFREIFSTLADPASRFVDRSPLSAAGDVWPVFENGPRSEKVDLLVLGDGYSAKELSAYREDVKRVINALFAYAPFSDRREDFNVWAIDVASQRSGVSQPRAGFYNSNSSRLDVQRVRLRALHAQLRQPQAPGDRRFGPLRRSHPHR